MDDEGNRRDRRRVLPVLLAVAAFAATPSLALDYQFRVYGAAAYVEPTANEALRGVNALEKVAHAWGYELGFEVKTPKLVGVELAYTDTTLDVQTTELSSNRSSTATIHFAPIHVSLNFHVVRTKTLSWWLGPTVSYAIWGDLQNALAYSIPADRTWGFGVSTGVIVSMVKPLAFQAGVRWIKLDRTEPGAFSEGGSILRVDSIAVNPVIVHVGLALRFGSSVAPVPQEKRTDTQD